MLKGDLMKEYINRQISKEIEQALEKFSVVIITGPRQVGKSTMLKNMLPKEKYGYVTLDNPLDRDLARNDPELFLKRYTFPVIIDEIQYAPELLPYIKIIVDNLKLDNNKNKNGAYILTGSQMFKLMNGVSETLSGRARVFNMYGLTYNEILGENDEMFVPKAENLFAKKNKNISLQELFERIYRGSYPEIAKNPNISPEEFYSSYIQTYLERDIRDVIKIKDESKFLKFLSSLAARTGKELVYEDIAKDIDSDIKTVQNWVSILKTSGIIYLLQPYSNNLIKKIIKRPKIYFMDTGLACFLARYTDSLSLEVSAYSGNIFETYVISEIIKKYANDGKYTDLYLYYYRDSNKKEIDLLICLNGKIHPIEIKKSANPKKEVVKNFDVLNKLDGQVSDGGIICMVDKPIPIDERNSLIPISYI